MKEITMKKKERSRKFFERCYVNDQREKRRNDERIYISVDNLARNDMDIDYDYLNLNYHCSNFDFNSNSNNSNINSNINSNNNSTSTCDMSKKMNSVAERESYKIQIKLTPEISEYISNYSNKCDDYVF